MKSPHQIIFFRRGGSPYFYAAIRIWGARRRIRRSTGIKDPTLLPAWESLCKNHLRRSFQTGEIFPFPKS